MCPPTTSTLCPSTTLSRSDHAAGGHRHRHHRLARPRRRRGQQRHCQRGGDGRQRESHRVHSIGLRDRKSTRLNSSHVKTSYAVFCLKKKEKTATNRQRA